MSRPSPFDPDTQTLWDHLVLIGPSGRATTPGVATVEVDTGIAEDIQEVDGQDGTTTTFLGYRPAEVTVNITVWTAEQYNKLRAIIELYRSARGVPPKPVDAIHPELEIHDIRQVYIFGVSSKATTAKTGYVLTLKMREWWPETKRVTKAAEPLEEAAPAAAMGSNASISDLFGSSILAPPATPDPD